MATDDNKKVEAKAPVEKAPEAKAPVEKAPEVKAQPKVESIPAPQPKLQNPSETKIKFLPWFTAALNRFDGVKAHHMTSVRAYFRDLGLGEPEMPESYDQGLIKFGFGRKK